MRVLRVLLLIVSVSPSSLMQKCESLEEILLWFLKKAEERLSRVKDFLEEGHCCFIFYPR